MLLAHAITLAQARSAISELADRAHNTPAAVEYERVLLQLDWIHAGIAPGITPPAQTARDVLFGIAQTAIDDLAAFGIDPLQLELVLDMLVVAHDQDRP